MEISKLQAKLISLLVDEHLGKDVAEELAAIQQQIRWLTEDLIVAGKIVGLMSPFEADTVDLSVVNFDGFSKQPKTGKWRWPMLQRAVDWLRSSALISLDEIQALVNTARKAVFESGTITDPDKIDELRDAISDAAIQGEGASSFKRRMHGELAISKRETETLYRTNVKRAYLTGQADVLKKPSIQRVIPYVMYRATQDSRTRPAHNFMDGVIAESGSELHDLFERLQSQFNCRCVIVPISARRLNGRAVKAIYDIPQWVIEAAKV